jgi:predicted NAD/FAD-binding protein
LGAAWALSKRHEVHLFEADARLGGHANTVDVDVPEGTIAVDTGFIVFNDRTYPNLVRLFEALDVATSPSDMSFSFSVADGLEYGGNLAGLLTQPRRLLTKRYRRMISDIGRFRSFDPAELPGPDVTHQPFLTSSGYGDGFVDDYLVPMTSAIWSAKPADILEFPASTMLGFLENHGLIRITDRPVWRTVNGGSRSYVVRIAASIEGTIHLSSPVRRIRRDPSGVEIVTSDGLARFDQMVLAVHSDQALRILGSEATPLEVELLSAVRYLENTAVLHSDRTLMPRNRRAWTSWNHMADCDRDGRNRVSVTYWMNRLQELPTDTEIFVSLNPIISIYGNHIPVVYLEGRLRFFGHIDLALLRREVSALRRV